MTGSVGTGPGTVQRRVTARSAVVAVMAIAAAAMAGGVASAGARAVGVVVTLGAVALAIRGAGGRAPASALAVVDRHPLAHDSGLVVVTLGARRLLVGHGPRGVTLVAGLEGCREEVAP